MSVHQFGIRRRALERFGACLVVRVHVALMKHNDFFKSLLDVENAVTTSNHQALGISRKGHPLVLQMFAAVLAH